MKNAKLRTIGVCAGLAVSAATGTVFAQEGDAQAQASGQVGMGLPGATPQTTTTTTTAVGGTDHALVAGRMAVGYLGRTIIAVGVDGSPGADDVAAPIVGVRYWLDQGMGLDLGLGFGIQGGSNDPAADPPSAWAFAVHGGVPLALASGRHYTFEIIPELNVGLGGGSAAGAGPGGADVTNSGFALDIGARAGAEIQFGFIGIPELALQGSIGAMFQLSSVSSESGDTEVSQSNYSVGTTVQASPWAVFTNSVTALYYF